MRSRVPELLSEKYLTVTSRAFAKIIQKTNRPMIFFIDYITTFIVLAYSVTVFRASLLFARVTYARRGNKFHLVHSTGTKIFLHSRTCALTWISSAVFLFIVLSP